MCCRELATTHTGLDFVVGSIQAEDLALWNDNGVLEFSHLLKHIVKDGSDWLSGQKVVLLV